MDYNHNNISPLDNRYQNKISELREVFSEHALIKTRFVIEIDWLIFLCRNHSILRVLRNWLADNKLPKIPIMLPVPTIE